MDGTVLLQIYIYVVIHYKLAATLLTLGIFPTVNGGSCDEIPNLTTAAAITAHLFLRVVFPTHHSILQLVVEDGMRIAEASCNYHT